MKFSSRATPGLIFVVMFLFAVTPFMLLSSSAAGVDQAHGKIKTTEPIAPVQSPAVADLPTLMPLSKRGKLHQIPQSRERVGSPGFRNEPAFSDPLAPAGVSSGQTPEPMLSFDGMTGEDNPFWLVPPDPNGDVGPHHYVQAMNVSFAIYDKQGNVVKPATAIADLWKSAPGYCAGGDFRVVDPIVVYDQLADRWVLSHASQSRAWCIAVSKTPDPTGPYYLYEFDLEGGYWPDYQKLAVWHNGYYASSTIPEYGAVAFDRTNMLRGDRARMISAYWKPLSEWSRCLMPATIDGYNPPAPISPALYYIFENAGSCDIVGCDPTDRIELYEFKADFDKPDKSTFELLIKIPISPFKYRVCGENPWCIPEPDPGKALDPQDNVPAYRLVFRNMGGEYRLIGNFTIGLADDRTWAGIRWFELAQVDKDPWRLVQEGTWAPDDHNRWLGSIAMDGLGNIALGYSVSSSTLMPGIRFALREATDPLGTLRNESSMVEGTGVQLDSAAYRWGDYSRMSIDPSDDCTFWYTNQYYKESGEIWSTRIGSFKSPSCNPATFDFAGTVKDQNGAPIPGTSVSAGGKTSITNTDGSFIISGLTAGIYNVVAGKKGYRFTAPVTVDLPPPGQEVEIVGDSTPVFTASGTITGNGVGLSKVTVSIDGPVRDFVKTNEHGVYSFPNLPAGSYTITPSMKHMSFLPAGRAIQITTGDIGNQNFAGFRLTAGFSAAPVSGKAPLRVRFKDKSKSSAGSITRWIWEFGDGGVSTLKNPTYSYTKAGTYTVKLTVRNQTGARDTRTAIDYVRVRSRK